MQKKDQLEELSATGTIIPAPVVEEVRTGQQFLIKLQLARTFHTNAFSLDQAPNFPSIRVGRREAINTAGEPRTEAEPLTLQIIVHLVKSGQVRKGACAKCCHKVKPANSRHHPSSSISFTNKLIRSNHATCILATTTSSPFLPPTLVIVWTSIPDPRSVGPPHPLNH